MNVSKGRIRNTIWSRASHTTTDCSSGCGRKPNTTADAVTISSKRQPTVTLAPLCDSTRRSGDKLDKVAAICHGYSDQAVTAQTSTRVLQFESFFYATCRHHLSLFSSCHTLKLRNQIRSTFLVSPLL
jgi:hypothetical protein